MRRATKDFIIIFSTWNGRRTWACELSTIDSGLLLLGMLVAAEYFSGDNANEREIRESVEKLYHQVDWNWACNGALTLSHGYKPRGGFLKYRWQGYSEGLILYLLALGSPSHPLQPENYHAWTQTYQWQKIYDREFLYAGPLFIHQFLHVWCDFRGLQDDFMKEKSLDYFENSRRATYIQHEYCHQNPLGFTGYSDVNWGITASDGTGGPSGKSKAAARIFMVIALAACHLARTTEPFHRGPPSHRYPLRRRLSCRRQHFYKAEIDKRAHYGFVASFNPSFRDSSPEHFWRSKFNYGLNQGPLVLMVENFRSRFDLAIDEKLPPRSKVCNVPVFPGGGCLQIKQIMKKNPEVVMITGAAAGIGRATAQAFAKRGARIGLLARGREGLEGAKRDVEKLGGRGLVLVADVADEKAVEAAAEKLENEFGPIDIWINDAMASVFSPIMEMTPEEFRRVTDVTYLGYVWGTMAALRRMRPRNRGTIIHVGSALAYRGIPLQSAYCAAKHAINGFTDSLRCELIHDKKDIHVCIVEMPAVNTRNLAG